MVEGDDLPAEGASDAAVVVVNQQTAATLRKQAAGPEHAVME